MKAGAGFSNLDVREIISKIVTVVNKNHPHPIRELAGTDPQTPFDVADEDMNRERFSVLLPLVCKVDVTTGKPDLQILYQVRAEHMRRQPGEIGFPGGRIESGETPEQTAIREATEELGVPSDHIKILGELNYITRPGFTLYCFLGTLDPEGADPNEDEVNALFSVSLLRLVEEGFDTVDYATHEDIVAPSGRGPLYLYFDETSPRHESVPVKRVIWGLTAKLTEDFIRLITHS